MLLFLCYSQSVESAAQIGHSEIKQGRLPQAASAQTMTGGENKGKDVAISQNYEMAEQQRQ
jgi:hypothetical protein